MGSRKKYSSEEIEQRKHSWMLWIVGTGFVTILATLNYYGRDIAIVQAESIAKNNTLLESTIKIMDNLGDKAETAASERSGMAVQIKGHEVRLDAVERHISSANHPTHQPSRPRVNLSVPQ